MTSSFAMSICTPLQCERYLTSPCAPPTGYVAGDVFAGVLVAVVIVTNIVSILITWKVMTRRRATSRPPRPVVTEYVEPMYDMPPDSHHTEMPVVRSGIDNPVMTNEIDDSFCDDEDEFSQATNNGNTSHLDDNGSYDEINNPDNPNQSAVNVATRRTSAISGPNWEEINKNLPSDVLEYTEVYAPPLENIYDVTLSSGGNGEYETYDWEGDRSSNGNPALQPKPDHMKT